MKITSDTASYLTFLLPIHLHSLHSLPFLLLFLNRHLTLFTLYLLTFPSSFSQQTPYPLHTLPLNLSFFLFSTSTLPYSPFTSYLSFFLSQQARTFIQSMPKFPKKDFSKYFVGANPLAVDLLSNLLVMDPDRRISAEDALAHPYFINYADPDDEVSHVTKFPLSS